MRPEQLKTVSIIDPAIESGFDDILEFAKSRDISKIRFRPGVEPQFFIVRAVPHRLWANYVMGGTTDSERYARCFLAGLQEVLNHYGDDGVAVASRAPTRDPQTGVINREELERFSPHEVEEIGRVIWELSFFPKRIEPTYRLPPTCLHSLIDLGSRPADASPTLPDRSSDSASPESDTPPRPPERTEQPKPESDARSGSRTGATAPGTA